MIPEYQFAHIAAYFERRKHASEYSRERWYLYHVASGGRG